MCMRKIQKLLEVFEKDFQNPWPLEHARNSSVKSTHDGQEL